MNSLTTWDHLFSIAVFVAYPLLAWRTYPAVAERIRLRGEPARIAEYRGTIAIWIGFAVALVLLWILMGREWADLGLRWADPGRAGLGLGLGLGLLWLTHVQLNRLVATGREDRTAVEHIGDLLILMPSNRRELAWFRGVAVNAGVTEELIYRGFLLWYLEPVVGTVGAALLAIAAFTLGHAYQGLANLPGIAFASTCFVGLYLLTGSLIIPVVLHATLDIIQGNALARLLDRPKEAGLEANEVVE
jgi:membrane protease YdiL (CAAX protease family)